MPFYGGMLGLVASLVILVPYAVRAYEISEFIMPTGYFGKPYWRSAPPGSLFPVPFPPGPLEILVPVESFSDLVLYALIQINLFPILLVILAIFCSFLGWAAFSPTERRAIDIVGENMLKAMAFLFLYSPVVGGILFGMILPFGVTLLFYLCWEPLRLNYTLWYFLTSGAIVPEWADSILRSSGWLLIVSGAGLLVIGLIQIVRSAAKQDKLVKRGLYSVVRHPQHLGIALLTLGIILAFNRYGIRPGDLIAWVILNSLYVVLALKEEDHLRRRYGTEFSMYASRVPFMIPLFPTTLSSFLSKSSPAGWRRHVLIFMIAAGLVIATVLILSLFPMTHPR